MHEQDESRIAASEWKLLNERAFSYGYREGFFEAQSREVQQVFDTTYSAACPIAAHKTEALALLQELRYRLETETDGGRETETVKSAAKLKLEHWQQLVSSKSADQLIKQSQDSSMVEDQNALETAVSEIEDTLRQIIALN